MSPKIEITRAEYNAVIEAGVALDVNHESHTNAARHISALDRLRLKMARALSGHTEITPEPVVVGHAVVHKDTGRLFYSVTGEGSAESAAAEIARWHVEADYIVATINAPHPIPKEALTE